jgi:NADP-dependent 3-hydroxy acid dehydrogenase YdfG
MSNAARRVFITGATSGIGEAIAQAFVRDGALVTSTGATEQEVQRASSVAHNKGIDFRVLDVRDDAAVQKHGERYWRARCRGELCWRNPTLS